MEKRFDVAYLVLKLELPFAIYPSLCLHWTRYVVRKHLPNWQGIKELPDELNNSLLALSDGPTDVHTREVEDVQLI